MAKPRRMASCHPDRAHWAKGLCIQCYNREKYRNNRDDLLEYNKKYYREHQEERRKYRQENNRRLYKPVLMRKYGITLENYDEMLEAQCNRCAICGKTPEENGKRLAVDHNHKTGKLRGLLCDCCNRLLGYSKDNIGTLSRAIEYLEVHREE